MAYTIGVDVGGTKVLGALVDENGKVLQTARRDTPREGGALRNHALHAVDIELMAAKPDQLTCDYALGFPYTERKQML